MVQSMFLHKTMSFLVRASWMAWVPEGSLAGFFGSHGGVWGAPGARESVQGTSYTSVQTQEG